MKTVEKTPIINMTKEKDAEKKASARARSDDEMDWQ